MRRPDDAGLFDAARADVAAPPDKLKRFIDYRRVDLWERRAAGARYHARTSTWRAAAPAGNRVPAADLIAPLVDLAVVANMPYMRALRCCGSRTPPRAVVGVAVGGCNAHKDIVVVVVDRGSVD